MFGSSLPSVACKGGGGAHVLYTLFVFVCVYWCVVITMCCDVRYDFHIRTILGSSLPPVFVCRSPMSYLLYLCLFAYGGGLFLFVFLLCPVYPMLPVSLDCPFQKSKTKKRKCYENLPIFFLGGGILSNKISKSYI